MILNSPTISGSLTVTGNIISSGSITMSGSQVISGSLTVFTGSLIEFQVTNTGTKIGNAITDIHTVTGSLTVSGSQTFIGTKTITGSVFISGSKTLIGTNTVSGSMLISGSLDVNGPITATTLIVQTITSSVEYITGSSINGSLNSNTHLFTGSVSISGSSTTALNVNAGTLFVSSSGQVGIGTTVPTYTLDVSGTGRFTSSLLVSGGATLSGTETTLNFNPQTNLLASYYYLNFGGGSIMYRNASDIYIASNAKYDSAGTTRANYTTANGMGMITMDGGQLNYQANATSVTAGTVYSMPIRFSITGAGNVGIGATSPQSLLDVRGATPFIRITDTAVNSESGLIMDAGGGTIRGGLTINYGTGEFKSYCGVSGNSYFQTFHTNGSERMRITSGGTATFFGQINSSMGNDQLFFNATSATTGYQYMNISNTSGGLLIGIEGTTLGNLQSGDIAYSSVITTRNASNLSLGTNQVERLRIASGGAITIAGSLSKGSGTFRIDHPLESKKDTHQLVHSFVEGPRADLIYRGTTTLVNGTATINIDTSAGMTEGTFVALNRETQFFITNQSGWNNIKGLLQGNILTIEAEDTNSTDTIAWMVVGERQDKHIKDTDWTDSNGKPILEPLKSTE